MNISSVSFLAPSGMLCLEVVDFLRLTPMRGDKLCVRCDLCISVLLTISGYSLIKALAVDTAIELVITDTLRKAALIKVCTIRSSLP